MLLPLTYQPVLFVLASEMMVDWLKHAFIAKFNHVRATVYGRFTDVLAKDVLLAGTIGSGRKRKVGSLLERLTDISILSCSTSRPSWPDAWVSLLSHSLSWLSAFARRSSGC